MPANSARVLLVTEDLALPSDEGLKKFVYSVSSALKDRVELKLVCTSPSGPTGDDVIVARANLLMQGGALRSQVGDFHPTHVVYIPRSGATRYAFVRSWRLSRLQPKATSAMIVLQTRPYGWLAGKIARVSGPDIVVTQGSSVRRALSAIHVDAVTIPSGVDAYRFAPVDEERKRRIRQQMGLPLDSRLVLHVGHLKFDRNVQLLARIRTELGCECAVVASSSTVQEPEVRELLIDAGVHVVNTYIEDIADVYRMADIYLFPVHEVGNAIEMPLSVLEALACGLPVVSTPFGSLLDWLPPSNAMTYAASDDELLSAVAKKVSLAAGADVNAARATALAFSWSAVASRLLTILGIEDQPLTNA